MKTSCPSAEYCLSPFYFFTRWLDFLMWFTLQYQDQAHVVREPTEEQPITSNQIDLLAGKAPAEGEPRIRGPAAILEGSVAAPIGNRQRLLPPEAATSLVLPVGFPVGWGLALIPEFQGPLGEFVNTWLAEALPKLWHETAFGEQKH